MPDVETDLGVRNAYAAYAHRIDDGDIRGWAELFTADGVMSVRDVDLVGHDALCQAMASSRADGVRSLGRHLIMNIEVLGASAHPGDRTVRAEADFLHVKAGTGGAYIEMIGRYQTTFRRVGVDYQFQRHEVVLLVDKRDPEVPLG